MNIPGIAYLTMVMILPDGTYGVAYDQFESNSVSVDAISSCAQAGEEFMQEDPARNIAFSCEFVPKQKDL